MLVLEKIHEDTAMIVDTETDTFFTVKTEEIKHASLGDVLVHRDGAYSVDKEATEKRRKAIASLEEKIWGQR
ncbi:MAG: DUF3006 domain-containing protein [Oscillospiraceae bacterium]|nr:DUF3006 domain-containing protein [Oscillospiraceae bacterium]